MTIMLDETNHSPEVAVDLASGKDLMVATVTGAASPLDPELTAHRVAELELLRAGVRVALALRRVNWRVLPHDLVDELEAMERAAGAYADLCTGGTTTEEVGG